MQYSALNYSAVQCSSVQYCTVQFSTLPFSVLVEDMALYAGQLPAAAQLFGRGFLCCLGIFYEMFCLLLKGGFVQSVQPLNAGTKQNKIGN